MNWVDEAIIVRRQIRVLAKDLPINDFTWDELMDLANIFNSNEVPPIRRDFERWKALKSKIDLIRTLRRIPPPSPEIDKTA